MREPRDDRAAPEAVPDVSGTGSGHLERGRTGGRLRPLIAASLVVAFVALAVAKPWDGDATRTADADPRAAPSPQQVAPSLVPTLMPSPTTERTPRPPIGEPFALPPPPAPADLASVLLPRDEWGMRAVVFAPRAGSTAAGPDAILTERWIRVDGAGEAGGTANATPVFAGDAVVALGFTVPAGVTPRSVRVWRVLDMELPQRVAVRPVDGDPSLGRLWLAGAASTSLGTWARATYRFDVLLDDRIVRIITRVPTGGPLGVPAEPRSMGPAPDVVSALAGGRSGLFAVDGPAVVTLPAIPGAPLDEAEAWAATCPPGAGECRVPTLRSRTTSALGVVLDPGAVPATAVLVQLGPISATPRVVAQTIPLSAGASGRAGLTAVILRVDSPGPLSSGLYRLTVSWRTVAGADGEASWHVEIAPPDA